MEKDTKIQHQLPFRSEAKVRFRFESPGKKEALKISGFEKAKECIERSLIQTDGSRSLRD